MRRFFLWLADQLRPLHKNGLDESLQIPPGTCSIFDREEMERMAGMSFDMQIAFGAFELIGLEYAKRASKAWRPKELFLMEDISMAFHLVEEQRQLGILIEPVRVERLIQTLQNYFIYLGEQNPEENARQKVELYLQEHSVADPESDPEAFYHVTIDHPLLDELRQIESEMMEAFPELDGRSRGFERVGLILDREIDDSRYPGNTPINCRTFACTGVGGTHFSLLVQDGGIYEGSLVVMTVPDAMAQSMIVGENLRDFLSLGICRGFFCLDSLTGNVDRAMSAFIDRAWRPNDALVDFEIDDVHRQILDYLASRLELQPWRSTERFHELQRDYMPQLKLPPDAEEYRKYWQS